MSHTFTLQELQQTPALVTTTLTLPTGEEATLRSLLPQDAPALGRYFLSLSDDTKRRYGPHPFDQATADALCASLLRTETLRMVGVRENGDIIAYFILVWGVGQGEISRYAEAGLAIDGTQDCLLAPSVADAYQSQGLGSQILPWVIEIARRAGRRKMVLMGGVQATNARGVHFYQKHGFVKIGDFESPKDFWNHDMWLAL